MNENKIDIQRRKLTKAAWATPIITAATLPVHAQTSATTTCSPMQICSASADTPLNGYAGGFAFDEQARSCDVRIGSKAIDFIIDVVPNTVFRLDNNSGGQFLLLTSRSAWRTRGINLPYTLIGVTPTTGAASGSVIFNITNNLTNNEYQVNVRATREQGPGTIDSANWTVEIRSIC